MIASQLPAPPPPIVLPTRDEIPPTLAALDRWVAWRWATVNGRPTKVPVDQATGHIGDATAPVIWRGIDATLSYCRGHDTGTAFVIMARDGLIGIDLDKCMYEDGALTEDAATIAAELGTYAEVSPSGTGIKIVARGTKPGTRCRAGGVEMYSDVRMFTITGRRLADAPADVCPAQPAIDAIYARLFPEPKAMPPHNAATTSPPMTDDKVVAVARGASNGSRFAALYDRGDTSGYDSGSEADSALLAMLSFYTQDRGQLEGLFAAGALCDLKWSNRPDYRRRTIDGVLGILRSAYTGPGKPAVLVTHRGGTRRTLDTGTGEITEEPIPDEQGSPPSPGAMPPFPMEALLSPTLQAWVEQASLATDTPHDFSAWGALAACSGAIGNSRIVQINTEWQETALLWVVLVGAPGTGKTPALNKAIAPLWAAQADLIDAWERERATYETDRAYWEQQPKAARGNAPTEPALKRFMTGDTTFEALANVLRANERGLMVVRDELAGWIESFNQYKKSGGQDRAAWLSTWSGSPILIDRKTDSYMAFIRRPYVPVVGTIQPGRLSAATGSVDDGFMDRLLFAYPDAWPMRWTERHVDPEVSANYAGLIRALLAMQMATVETAGKAASFPETAHLSDRARATFAEYFEAHRQEMIHPDMPGSLAGVWAKFRSYAGRLALVLHSALVADGVAQPFVGEERVVLASWALVEHLKSHARRVYNATSKTEEDHTIDRLVEWIRLHGNAATVREVVRGKAAGIKGAAAAEVLFASLVDRGLGRIERVTVRGGTSVRFVLGESPEGGL